MLKFFRFRLKTLMAMFTVFSIVFGLFARQAAIQREVVSLAIENRATIVYQYERVQREEGKKVITQPWLLKFLPIEYVCTVSEIWIPAYTPEDRLEQLRVKMKRLPGEPRLIPYFAH